LSAKETSYQMGFEKFVTLPESESVQNLETFDVLPSLKDGLMKVLQNYLNVNL
jgi:hypothetical protein